MENQDLGKDFRKIFSAYGITLPEKSITKLSRIAMEEVNDFTLFQRNGAPAIQFSLRGFVDFSHILTFGGLDGGFENYLLNNKTCTNSLFSHPSNKKEEVVIYWENDEEKIPGGHNIYKYFRSKGFSVINNAHPSYLVCAMDLLTETKLDEFGVLSYADIVLPTDEKSLIKNSSGELCFFRIERGTKKRRLSLRDYNASGLNSVFLLKKINKA